MYKKLLLIVFSFFVFAGANAQSSKIDTVAVSILDRMSAMIGELGSCSVTINTNYDINSKELGLVKHTNEYQLFLKGPDKLLVRSDGDKGSQTLSYNGEELTYYSHDRNQYGQILLKTSIMKLIDSVNRIYGIEFPGADFFYPTFVDDILTDSKNLAFLGVTKVNGIECFHIAGTAKDKTFQFWISDDAFYFPIRMVIVHTAMENSPQYEAVFSNWLVNPNFPDVMFEFNMPFHAVKVKMIPKTQKK